MLGRGFPSPAAMLGELAVMDREDDAALDPEPLLATAAHLASARNGLYVQLCARVCLAPAGAPA